MLTAWSVISYRLLVAGLKRWQPQPKFEKDMEKTVNILLSRSVAGRGFALEKAKTKYRKKSPPILSKRTSPNTLAPPPSPTKSRKSHLEGCPNAEKDNSYWYKTLITRNLKTIQ